MIYFILLLGLLLRLISLNQSLWLDEGTTGLVAQMSVGNILSNFIKGDFHPPLHYLFIRFWSLLFGSSEISLRFPSILFSLGSIFLVYKLWQKLINKKDAWIPALFLATSGLFIYYSQEARMYAMTAFLATLSVFSFVKIIDKKSRPGDWILFSLSIALLSFSDYLPNLIILAFWIYAWRLRNNFSWLKKFFMSHIILIVSWVWWLPYFIKQLKGGFNVSSNSPAWWNILGKFSFKEIFLIPTKFIIGRVSIDNKLLYAIVVGILFLLFGYLVYMARKKVKLIWLWLLFPIITTILISIKLPVLSYFRLLFVLPAFYFLVAVGLSALKRTLKINLALLILFINLIFSGLYLLNPRFHREDWRGMVGYISKTSKGKTSSVVFPTNAQQEAYNYYTDKKAVPYATIGSDSDIIWLVRYIHEIADPEDLARKKVDSLGYTKTEEENFNGVIVWKYEK